MIKSGRAFESVILVNFRLFVINNNWKNITSLRPSLFETNLEISLTSLIPQSRINPTKATHQYIQLRLL